MGLNYAESLLKARLVVKEDILILEKQKTTIEKLKKRDYTMIYEVPGDFIQKADVIILSVKPQDWKGLAHSMAEYTEEDQVFVSIMAII